MIANFFDAIMTTAINVYNVVRNFGFADLFDVAAVAFIIYHAMKIVRETRAMQFVKAIVVIFAVYIVADQLNMISLRFLVQALLNVGVIALVVLFQPELRRALEQMGRSKISDINVFGTASSGGTERIAHTQELIAILVESCREFSAGKTGALIAVERQIKLGDVIDSGTVIDSRASSELIVNIFFKNSPLHDGAMIIRDNRLYAAACYLPLSANMEIARDLGTRHRAALGLSEESDAVVIVVSEETGTISAALESELHRGLTDKNLEKLLAFALSAGEEGAEQNVKNPLSKILGTKNSSAGKAAQSKKRKKSG